MLTYVTEAAYGELKDLLHDVGISRHTTRFMNVADLNKVNESWLKEDDKQAKHLANARFTMLDMTDYETDFASWNELP